MTCIEDQTAVADQNFDELRYEFLSDDQLIMLIEQAQEEIDRRHPFDLLQSLKCPACGQTDNDFWIGCHFVATLDKEGAYIPMDTDDKPCWGAESGCRCPSCDHSGRVIDFLPLKKENQ